MADPNSTQAKIAKNLADYHGTPSDGDLMRYNSGSSRWIPDIIDLDDLGNVVIATPSTGQVVKYTGSQWQNQAINQRIHELIDVDITSPANGALLRFNSTSGSWEDDDLSLGELNDVVTSGVQNGDFLTYNQGLTRWEPGSASGSASTPHFFSIFNEDISTTGSAHSTTYEFVPNSLRITWNGVRQDTSEFTEDGDYLGFTTNFDVSADDSLIADYHKPVTSGSTDAYWDGNAIKLQGRNISSGSPADGEGLVWNEGSAQWEPGVVSSGSVPTTIKIIWSADAPPNTSGSADDEFDDESVDGAWSEWDPGSFLTVTEIGTGLKFVVGSGNYCGGIYRAVPAIPFTIWTRVYIDHPQTSEIQPGILLGEDLSGSPSTSDAFIWSKYQGGAGTGLQALLYNDYANLNTAPYNVTSDIPLTGAYLRMRVTSGPTLDLAASLDGVSWYERLQSYSLPFTPGHIGLGLHANTSATHAIYFPFFRMVNVGPAQLLGGNMIRLLGE